MQGALTGISSIAETVVPIGATAVFAWSLGIPMPGLVLIGGPSNAGALFVDWARSLLRLVRTNHAPGDGRSGDPRR